MRLRAPALSHGHSVTAPVSPESADDRYLYQYRTPWWWEQVPLKRAL